MWSRLAISALVSPSAISSATCISREVSGPLPFESVTAAGGAGEPVPELIASLRVLHLGEPFEDCRGRHRIGELRRKGHGLQPVVPRGIGVLELHVDAGEAVATERRHELVTRLAKAFQRLLQAAASNLEVAALQRYQPEVVQARGDPPGVAELPRDLESLVVKTRRDGPVAGAAAENAAKRLRGEERQAWSHLLRHLGPDIRVAC